MNANKSDIRLHVATDQCTIFSSANQAGGRFWCAACNATQLIGHAARLLYYL